MSSQNNVEIAIYLSAVVGLLESGKIPISEYIRVEVIFNTLVSRMDKTGDVSAEQMVNFLEEKFVKSR